MSLAIPNTALDIKAKDWNDLLALLRVWKMGGLQPRTTGLNHRSGGGGGSRFSRVLMRNDTGSNVDMHGVLAMQAPLSEDATNFASAKFESPVFKGIVPTSAYYGKWAILQEPAPYESGIDNLYWAVCAGCTWCLVTVNDEQDVAVEHNNSTSQLVSGMHGSARILWKESGTGQNKVAFISIGDWVTEFVGKADAEITALGGSGTVSVWTANFGADTNVNVANCINDTGLVIESGKRCKVTSILGALYAEPWECPA